MIARVHQANDLPPDLAALVEGLQPGDQQVGLLCPACVGGRSAERSLDIRHNGPHISLKCWRAGCTYYARIPKGASFVHSAPRFSPRPYTRALEAPSPGHLHGLAIRWGLTASTISRGGVMYAPEEAQNSLWLPVYGPLGHERGGVIKRLDKACEGPKNMTYKTTDAPWSAWYTAGQGLTGDFLVVVEDQISAMRAYQAGYSALSLMGVELGNDRVEEIAALHGQFPVLLALDKDAFGNAVRHCLQYKDRLNMRPVLLGKDLKDLYEDADVRAVLSA